MSKFCLRPHLTCLREQSVPPILLRVPLHRRASRILHFEANRASGRNDGKVLPLRDDTFEVTRLAHDPRCYWLPPHKSLPSREALALRIGLRPFRQVADTWPLGPADNQPNPCGAFLNLFEAGCRKSFSQYPPGIRSSMLLAASSQIAAKS